MSSSIPPESESSQGGPGPHGQPPRPPVTSDELLPPVEPPSARFIIQLFVIPALIVAVVVLIWFGIESLARSGEQDPDAIVAALRSSNQARFQQAKELADMLRLPERYPELKTNQELAQKLAAYLDEMIEAGSTAEAEVTMRIFLVTALGEFHVDDGLPVLIKAAQSDPERDVRRRAINAIAVLMDGLAEKKQTATRDELVAALLELADDQDELIRSETAFALGVVAASSADNAELIAKLQELADDPYTDARFNAAVGLARAGAPGAARAVAEMLDPESIAASVSGEKPLTEQVTDEQLAGQKAFKRNTIINSALTAIDRLLENPDTPRGEFAVLQTALETFIKAAPAMKEPAPVPGELVEAAERTLEKVKQRAAK
ncbi:MAG TPA: HEAT repeat domain-containing protein [Lacipirellula sp.]